MEGMGGRGRGSKRLVRWAVRALRIAVRLVAAVMGVIVGWIARASSNLVRRAMGTGRWVRETEATTRELITVIDRLEAELAASHREVARLEWLMAQRSPEPAVRRSA